MESYTLPRNMLILFIVGALGFAAMAITEQSHGPNCGPACGIIEGFVGGLVFVPMMVVSGIVTISSFVRRKKKGFYLSKLHRVLALSLTLLFLAYIGLNLLLPIFF